TQAVSEPDALVVQGLGAPGELHRGGEVAPGGQVGGTPRLSQDHRLASPSAAARTARIHRLASPSAAARTATQSRIHDSASGIGGAARRRARSGTTFEERSRLGAKRSR